MVICTLNRFLQPVQIHLNWVPDMPYVKDDVHDLYATPPKVQFPFRFIN